jgi:MtaA/CmuA family methyltransferase
MNGFRRVTALMAGEAVDRLPLMPITMMFAADVCGVKYREYATRHEVLVEAQLRTAETFAFDHVSCVSDPAREAADCGANTEMFDDQPPAVVGSKPLLADKQKLIRMNIPDPRDGGRMHDRILAVSLFRKLAGGNFLIEGWVEGPCAAAANLRGMENVMADFLEDPGFVKDLFAFTLKMELEFARAQIEAGADIVGIGDAAASLVGPEIYRKTVWPFEKQLIDGVHALGCRVRLHICGNTNPLLDEIGKLGCDIVDLDSMVSLAGGRRAMGESQILLGNLDPVRVLRNRSAEDVRRALAACHREAGSRYIAGAGCEIPRDTSEANVRAMVDFVMESGANQKR